MCTAIFQCIPAVSTNSPIVIIIPLSFVIGMGILQELIGELKRYNDDKKTNAIPACRLACKGTSEFEETNLAGIKVGDILKIQDYEEVPADCVLIKTESEKGEAFVKTSQLDGERNLKPKLAIPMVHN